tara:strand:- start:2011 stop:2379 length:369 start_codon:yes stop_codon:yes gene_type:complete
MKTQKSRIHIDLAPYEVSITGYSKIVIEDSINSILGKLDNNPEVTGFDSRELQFTEIIDNLWVKVSVKDNDVIFERVYGRKRLTIERFQQWLIDNWDAIDSIGCEMLKSNKSYQVKYIVDRF